MAKGLEGLRILIVEDEHLVAMEIEEVIQGLGAEVVGPFGRLVLAQDVARRESLDGAILDVRLNGDWVYPLADELLARGVPVILATGYDTERLPPRFQHLSRLQKPFEGEALDRMAETTFRQP